MALPKNVEDLLSPNDIPPLTEDWSQQFASYSWCRLVGFPGGVNSIQELRIPAPNGGTRPLLQKESKRILLSADLRKEAGRRIPKAWKEHEDFSSLGWDNPLGKGQVVTAFKREPAIPFDRACLVIAALDVLLGEFKLGDYPIRQCVRIAPAIFRHSGFTGEFFRRQFVGTEKKTQLNQLMKFSGNTKIEFFSDISQGRGATFTTLEKVESAIRAELRLPLDGEISPLPGRTRHTKAARFENSIFPND